MALSELELADECELESNMESNMEVVQGYSGDAAVMEAPRSACHTVITDPGMVGCALVGRRGHLQA